MEPNKGKLSSSHQGLVQTLNDDGTLNPQCDPHLSADEVRHIYKHMVQTRWLDERLTALQRQGRIGFHVGSLGEEGSIIGSAFAMRQVDWLFPCYREFGAALMRGLDFQRFIDNMFGNANDTVKGRQMPDHYTSRATHWLSISSPVGTQITHGVGLAWAAKLRNEDAASLIYFGDGATSSNDFHAGMNFAGVFQVPALFFCRNNGWAISVPAERQSASESFAQKGLAYGVPGVRVDGNDVFAVVHVVREALKRASQGGGATLIEALTYRMGGHSTSDDPNAYRGSDDLALWTGRDPIARAKRYLEQHNEWDDAREQAVKSELERRFREAVEIAERTEKPALETMFNDVYEDTPWHLEEQRAELLSGQRPGGHH